MTADQVPAEVHVVIDHLVVSGLSRADSQLLVSELRAGLTAAFSGQPAIRPATRPATSTAASLGRTAAAGIARVAGRH